MVTAVKVTSPTRATVTYDILIGGKPALSNQTRTAAYQGQTWKVGDGSFCQLLALENGGKAPPYVARRVPQFTTSNIVAFCGYFSTFATFFFTARSSARC